MTYSAATLSAMQAKNGTSEAPIRLTNMTTPRMDVTLPCMKAPTSSGVIVGDISGEKPGNRKNAIRNNTPATGVVHNRISWPLVFMGFSPF